MGRGGAGEDDDFVASEEEEEFNDSEVRRLQLQATVIF